MPSLFHKGDTVKTLFHFLTLCLLLTMPKAFSTPVLFGDGISLTAFEDAFYLSVSAGEADAGITTTYQDVTSNIFQIFDANGNNDSNAPVMYGKTVSLQLTTTNLWVTLDPGSTETPGYIRNNAPQVLPWEQLQLVSADSNSGEINYGESVYLAHTPDNGRTFTYVNISIENGTASTTNEIGQATPLIVQLGSFTPYSQAPGGTAVQYGDTMCLNFYAGGGGTYGIDITGNTIDSISLTGPNNGAFFGFMSVPLYPNTQSGIALYGAPIYLGTNSWFVTMNPVPSTIRNNVSPSTPGVWEQMYFIPANGSRNGDVMYYGDTCFLARNGLSSGNFVTEYLTIDYIAGEGTTTVDVTGAAALILVQPS